MMPPREHRPKRAIRSLAAALLAAAASRAVVVSGGRRSKTAAPSSSPSAAPAATRSKPAGTRGSISGERPTGPNLDKRKLTKDEALFAIRNGGFSGAIMPQNIVVGKDAEAVAEFLAKYAGSEAKGAARRPQLESRKE